MSLINLKFSTSNKKKQEEISQVSNIPFTHSIDLPEIDSNDYILVAAHKAKDIYQHTGIEGIITEDSILIIDGVVCTDIKFKYEDFKNNISDYIGKPVSFVVTLSVVVGDNIYCFKNSIKGTLGNENDDGYVFDPYIFVDDNGTQKSLAKLEQENRKQLFSPRTGAIRLLEDYFNEKAVNNDNIYSFKLKEISRWQGNYQS